MAGERQHTPEPQTRWMVKCDDCKRIMSFTNALQESYRGGICLSCKYQRGWTQVEADDRPSEENLGEHLGDSN